MLILSNEEIDSLLTVESALKALEHAYIGQAEGTAVNRPLRRFIRNGNSPSIFKAREVP